MAFTWPVRVSFRVPDARSQICIHTHTHTHTHTHNTHASIHTEGGTQGINPRVCAYCVRLRQPGTSRWMENKERVDNARENRVGEGGGGGVVDT